MQAPFWGLRFGLFTGCLVAMVNSLFFVFIRFSNFQF